MTQNLDTSGGFSYPVSSVQSLQLVVSELRGNVMKASKCLVFLALLVASGTHAANVYNTFTIRGFLSSGRVVSDNVAYGGCMVKVSPAPSSLWSQCAGDYLSFSCSGVFNSKSDAASLLSTAQLAYVMNKQVIITVENGNLHNTFCTAHTMQLIH